MRSKKFYLISILIAVVCINIQAQEDLLYSENKPLLIGRPYPALAGIGKFYVLIEAHQSLPDEGGLDWKKLDTQVKEKLEKENIEVTFVTDTPNMARPGALQGASVLPESVTGNSPSLLVFVDMLKLEESNKYVFHIQTSFRKKAYLSSGSSSFIKVSVWETGRDMQAVTFQDMPLQVTNVVLRQVGVFIQAYRAANPEDGKLSDADKENNIFMKAPEEQAKPTIEIKTAKFNYVASKSSEVFHKPDCRWAQNISQENLVGYSSREEAIKAGKRPCKSCNP